MNTKKAVIIGGLSVLLVGLTSFAIKTNKRKEKNQENTQETENKNQETNIFNSYNKIKQKITIDNLSDGANFYISQANENGSDTDMPYRNPESTTTNKIWNLENTIWTLNKTLSNETAEGKPIGIYEEEYNDSFIESYDINFTFYNYVVGYSYEKLRFYQTQSPNNQTITSASLQIKQPNVNGYTSIYWWNHNNDSNYWNHEYFRVIHFSDNNTPTAQNTKLIDWLYKNATFQGYEKTNLTNSTWTLNNSLTNKSPNGNLMTNTSLGQDLYSINFTSSGTNYIALNFFPQNQELYYISNNISTTVYSYNGTPQWNFSWAKTITITGGQDITNNNLIRWLYLNGHSEQTIDQQTYKSSFYTEEKSDTNLTIQQIQLSQKHFSYNRVISENIFLLKFLTIGNTSKIEIAHAIFHANIQVEKWSTYNRYPIFNNTIKIKTLTNNDSPYIWSTKYKNNFTYEEMFDQIPTKTTMYYGKTNQNTQNDISHAESLTYNDIEGARIGNSYLSSWQIPQNEFVNIWSGYTKVNYFAVYFKSEVNNILPLPAENTTSENSKYENTYNRTGYNRIEQGNIITSYPVLPPSTDIEGGNFVSLTGMMLDILSMPFTFITKAFDITLWEGTAWAFSIRKFIIAVIAIMALLFVIKLFTSGFSVLGNFTGKHDRNALTRSQTKLNKEKIKTEKHNRERNE